MSCKMTGPSFTITAEAPVRLTRLELILLDVSTQFTDNPTSYNSWTRITKVVLSEVYNKTDYHGFI